MKSDSELRIDVLAELMWDPRGPEALVGVAVKEGAIALTGHLDLDNSAQKIATRRAVERVSGVKTIAMELEVNPRSQPRGGQPSGTSRRDYATGLRWPGAATQRLNRGPRRT